jgi:hypothetical protein
VTRPVTDALENFAEALRKAGIDPNLIAVVDSAGGVAKARRHSR